MKPDKPLIQEVFSPNVLFNSFSTEKQRLLLRAKLFYL
jgi:hypothetical protein